MCFSSSVLFFREHRDIVSVLPICLNEELVMQKSYDRICPRQPLANARTRIFEDIKAIIFFPNPRQMSSVSPKRLDQPICSFNRLARRKNVGKGWYYGTQNWDSISEVAHSSLRPPAKGRVLGFFAAFPRVYSRSRAQTSIQKRSFNKTSTEPETSKSTTHSSSERDSVRNSCAVEIWMASPVFGKSLHQIGCVGCCDYIFWDGVYLSFRFRTGAYYWKEALQLVARMGVDETGRFGARSHGSAAKVRADALHKKRLLRASKD